MTGEQGSRVRTTVLFWGGLLACAGCGQGGGRGEPADPPQPRASDPPLRSAPRTAPMGPMVRVRVQMRPRDDLARILGAGRPGPNSHQGFGAPAAPRRPLRVHARIVQLQVTPKASRRSIRATLQKQLKRIAACYLGGLGDPVPPTLLEVTFRLAPRGGVLRVPKVTKRFTGGVYATCVTRRIWALKFPKPERKDRPVDVTVTLEFSQKRPSTRVPRSLTK